MKKLFCTIVLLILAYIGLQAQSCFTPVWTGNGYDHMNFYVYSAVYNGVDLQSGDEIGIFDGNSCVGRATLTGVITESNYLSIVAVQDDPGTPAKDGFTVGNTVTFRYCINQTAPTVDNVQVTYVAGTGLFSQGGSAEVQLTGLTNTFTITASAGTGGTISPSGSVQVASGGSQTFSIIANVGYEISDVLVNGSTVGVVSIYIFNNVMEDQSIVASFVPIALPNIALNKPATAKSSLSSTTNPGKAVDSDASNASRWAGGPSPSWWKVDLGGVYDISRVIIRNYVNGVYYYHYTIESSVDDQNYTQIASKTNNNPATNEGDDYSVTATARYLRVNMNYNSGSAYVYITDFRVYGQSVGFIVNSSAGSGGTINPAGDVLVNSGTSQTFTIIPDVGFEISDVLVNGSSVGAVGSYTFPSVDEDCSIRAEFRTLTNIALNKPSTAQSSLSSTTLPEKAVDSDGSNASRWAAGPSPQWWKVDLGGLYNIDGIAIRNYVNGVYYYHYNIEGSVDDQNYTLIASKTNNNPATNDGDKYRITATARYLRVNMSYNSGSTNVYITDFRVYGEPVVYEINSTAGTGGTISPVGLVQVISGSSSTFTITPDVGFQVSNVIVNSSSVGAVTSYTFPSVSGDQSIRAEFTALPNIALYKPATAQSSLSSTTQPDKAVDTDGSNASRWAGGPAPRWWKVDLGNLYDVNGIVIRNYVNGVYYYHYNIESSVDDINYTPIATKTDNNPATDDGDEYRVSATARYLRVNMTFNSGSTYVYITDFRVYGQTAGYIISSSCSAGGIINPSGEVTVNSGEAQTFNIVPDVGFELSDVIVNGSSVSAVTSYTFPSVSGNNSIRAEFTALPNIALNKPATAQSSLSSTTQPEKAVDLDGSNASRWAAGPSPRWWKVDLGGLYNINGIVIRNYVNGLYYFHYTIEGSADDVNYTQIASKTDNSPATNEGDDYRVTTTARYLRVTMNYNSGASYVYITDFRAYGILLPGSKGESFSGTKEVNKVLPEKSLSGEIILEAYPNPFEDHLSVMINSSFDEEFDLSIFDLGGRKVLVRNGIPANSPYLLDLKLEKGIYILLVNNDERRITSRIIRK